MVGDIGAMAPVVMLPELFAARAVSGERMIVASATRETADDLIWIKR
jgi:hypothetical protein